MTTSPQLPPADVSAELSADVSTTFKGQVKGTSKGIRRDDAARELMRRRAARESLADFTTYTKPNYYVNWHHRVMFEYLDRMVRGEIRRLMVFMPPRHGKSEAVSRRLPAYILGRNPEAQIIACSYSADLAGRMNRDVQRIMDSNEYRRVFPNTELSGKNIRTVAHGSYLRNSDVFEIVNHNGIYRSAGVGGGITGMGFDIGIIDDPIKDRQEADSEVYRETTWEWYTSTFYTRQAKDASILLTLTRWHEDDLAGRLLQQMRDDPRADQWEVIKFPAVLDEEPSAEDPREQGEALWPTQFNLDFFDTAKAQDGRQWDALYQQRPTSREGAFFKVTKLATVDVAPAELKACRGWDLASTPNGGDYTAGVKVAGPDSNGLWYVLHVARKQLATDDRNALMLTRAIMDGRGCRIQLAKDPGQAGVGQAEALIKMLAGYKVTADRISGNKEARADPFSSQVNAGNVRLVRGEWNTDFIEELRQFPMGKYDDQVDAASDAFNALSQKKRGGVVRWDA